MKNSQLGTISLFISAFLYGFYGIFSRLIGSAFGDFNQNWIRNLIVLVLITLVIIANKTQLKKIQKEDTKWLLLWFLSGSWITILTFIAFNHIQITTVYLALYASMITSGFISGKIFFKEKLDLSKKLSLLLCFVGLLIIYKLSIQPSEVFFVLLTLISGFMTGIWNTISKKFSDHYHNNQIVMMDALSSVIAAFIGSLVFKEVLPSVISSLSWVWISLYAIVTMSNVGLIVYGFKNIEAQIGSIIMPVEIIFATIFSFLIFKETPSLFTFIGGSLILIAAIIPNLRFKHND